MLLLWWYVNERFDDSILFCSICVGKTVHFSESDTSSCNDENIAPEGESNGNTSNSYPTRSTRQRTVQISKARKQPARGKSKRNHSNSTSIQNDQVLASNARDSVSPAKKPLSDSNVCDPIECFLFNWELMERVHGVEGEDRGFDLVSGDGRWTMKSVGFPFLYIIIENLYFNAISYYLPDWNLFVGRLCQMIDGMNKEEKEWEGVMYGI